MTGGGAGGRPLPRILNPSPGPPSSQRCTTTNKRVGMMREMAVQAYAVTGIPIPDCDRSRTPVRVVCRDEADA